MLSFEDKIKNIIKLEKSVSLRFLSLSEQTYLFRKRHIILDGGYPEAEKKRAYCYMKPIDNIACYQIKYNKAQLMLTHQNILGTLLSLGITYDSVGDILPKQGVFFITKEIEEEVLLNFTSINRVPIELIRFNSENVYSEIELEEYRTTLESLRLDLVVSKIAKVSREIAKTMINEEMVKLNHKVNKKPTTLVYENDTVSIRKHGRFIVQDTSKKSKKGKIVFKYAKYM